MRKSLREYWQKTRGHSLWLLFTGVAGLTWLLDALNVYEMRGAIAVGSAALVCLVVAQFMAFRDVLEERDAARQQLLTVDQDRPQLTVDYACDNLHIAYQRLVNSPREVQPVVIVNRGKADAYNVNIDKMEFTDDTASFATIPRMDGMSSAEVRPNIVGNDNTVSTYSDHFVSALIADRIAAGQKRWQAGQELRSLTWRMRLVYKDFAGTQYESLCDVYFDGGDSSVKTVFVRSTRLTNTR